MTRFLSVGVSITLLILTLLLFHPIEFTGDSGLCLLSPNQWHLPGFLSWLINVGIIFICTAVIALANKKYNFIQEAEPVLPMSLLLLLACNCVTSVVLSTSTLLLLFNVSSIFILLSTYEERNATRQSFIIASLIAIGAMVQYAFIVMAPVYILGGIAMKSFRLREFVAFVFGLAAPYWIALGLGWISPLAFHLPESLIAFSTADIDHDMFMTLLATGAMALTGFILSLYNGMRLFSRNSQLRCMHIIFNVMGYVSVVAAIFDFSNFTAYFGTIALWVAVQFASLLSLYNIRHPRVAMLILLLIFLPFYILAL